MLPIGQTIRSCGIKSLLNFVPGYRNTTLTLIDETQNNPKAMWKTINKVLHKNSNHTVTPNIIFEGTEFTTAGPKLAEKIEIQPSDDPLKVPLNVPGSSCCSKD